MHSGARLVGHEGHPPPPADGGLWSPVAARRRGMVADRGWMTLRPCASQPCAYRDNALVAGLLGTKAGD